MTNTDTHTIFESHPVLRELATSVQNSNPAADVQTAMLGHLAEPRLPAAELAQLVQVPISVVREAYLFLQQSEAARMLTTSWFYPYRMYYDYAGRTLDHLLAEPEYFDSLLQQRPLFSRVLEIHPSKGTCDYGCVMCLWSDKKTLTYASQLLNTDGLMQVADWERLLLEANALGTRTVVFSGGGEIFLNAQVLDVLEIAHKIGLKIHIYTNGYSLPVTDRAALDKILLAEQIRFSIHSPIEETYNAITSMPKRVHALQRVCERISMLLAARRTDCAPRVGIGFVIQPHNVGEIVQMVEFAQRLGVDFLNIRKDEVDVTEMLSADQMAIVKQQINVVRDCIIESAYEKMFVDMSDELISIANGLPIRRRRVRECLTKLIRPTISPYGVMAPCDLKAEPRFADGAFNLGQVRHNSLIELTEKMATTFIPDTCQECMPSSRTSNAVFSKFLDDYRAGIRLVEEPFYNTIPESLSGGDQC